VGELEGPGEQGAEGRKKGKEWKVWKPMDNGLDSGRFLRKNASEKISFLGWSEVPIPSLQHLAG
jgi:hypothetical protein